MSSPFVTCELKSAPSFEMRPLTCAPTCTVTSAESVPLAVTFAVMRRVSTFAVLYAASGLACAARHRHAPSVMATNANAAPTQRTIRFVILPHGLTILWGNVDRHERKEPRM
jgi:hypothetical protein